MGNVQLLIKEDQSLNTDAELKIERANCQMIRDGYGEDQAFWIVNERIFSRAGATWMDVRPLLSKLNSPIFIFNMRQLISKSTFHELRDYLESMPDDYSGQWGWKDPHNSLTLPLWLTIFPDAQVLHVKRAPEKVADNILRRQHDWQCDPPTGKPPLHKRLRNLIKYPHRFKASVMRRLASTTLTRETCLDLWRISVDECDTYKTLGDRFMEITYEEILEEPGKAVERLAAFCCIETDIEKRNRAESLVQRPIKR